MTKIDLINHNIAIAIYEGYKFIKNDANPALFSYGGYLENPNAKKHTDKVILPELLDYHKSYNSIMRIVELIEKTNDTLTIYKDKCRIVTSITGIRYYSAKGDMKFPSKKMECLYLMIIDQLKPKK